MISLLALFATVLASTQAPSYFPHGIGPYQGLATTRTIVNQLNNSIDTTNRQVMVRTTHRARDTLSNVRILASNFYLAGNGVETGIGSNATITASVEFPSGTCTQIKFATLSSGTILDGSTLLSDFSSISIPTGSQYWLRRFVTTTTGAIYYDTATNYTITGDALKVAVSGLTDQTLSCDAITGGNGGFSTPLGIISNTTRPTICIIGDSVGFGFFGVANTDGDRGLVAPSIAPSFGYINLSLPGARTTTFINNHAAQAAVFQYCSHLIVQSALNDIGDFAIAGTPAATAIATLKTRLQTIYALFPATTRIFQTTVSPGTTTTDNCTTIGGQTLISAVEAIRVPFNDDLRSGAFVPPNGGFLEVADALETSHNSGFWKTSPQPWSPDCSHLTTFGFAQLVALGTIDLAKIHRPFRRPANDNQRYARRRRRAA